MKLLKALVLVAAVLLGLAGVVAALLVEQVPAGHRLEVEGVVYPSGVIYAPFWVETTLLPPADPPRVDPTPAPPSAAPVDLDARLEAARAALAAAEQAAADAASETDEAFATAEREHLATLTERRLAGERRLAALEAEAMVLRRQRAAEAAAEAEAIVGDARAAFGVAVAERDRLLAVALAGDGGRYYVAIEAARRFRIGAVHLPDPPPEFLQRMGSLEVWRRFFLGAP